MDTGRKLHIVICGSKAEFEAYCQWKKITKGDPWVRAPKRTQDLDRWTRGVDPAQVRVTYFGNYWLNPLVGDWRLERAGEVVKA